MPAATSQQPYDIGDIVEVVVALTVQGTLTDPTAITFAYKTPDGVVTNIAQIALTHVGVGTYQYNIPITQTGDYTYRWVSTGTAAGAEESIFSVRRRLVT